MTNHKKLSHIRENAIPDGVEVLSVSHNTDLKQGDGWRGSATIEIRHNDTVQVKTYTGEFAWRENYDPEGLGREEFNVNWKEEVEK